MNEVVASIYYSTIRRPVGASIGGLVFGLFSYKYGGAWAVIPGLVIGAIVGSGVEARVMDMPFIKKAMSEQ